MTRFNVTLVWCGKHPRTEQVEMTTTEFEKLINEGMDDGHGSAVERVELAVREQDIEGPTQEGCP
jgi:hypothetical protein